MISTQGFQKGSLFGCSINMAKHPNIPPASMEVNLISGLKKNFLVMLKAIGLNV